MSSPCLSGGGRTYGFDLEIMKSTSTSTRTSQTSTSPSSTISESSNSPLAISTRKPRTPRKRPNQTYNEAAALLSTAYPGIFSAKHLTDSHKFTRPHDSALLLDDPPELLLPFRVFDNSGFLLHQQQQQHPIRQKPSFFNDIKAGNSTFFDKSSGGQSSCEVNSHGNSAELCDGYEDDFDAESILDEEIEEGIDSIMGNLSVGGETAASSDQNVGGYNHSGGGGGGMNCWYGNPMGLNFGGKFQFGHGMGMRRGVRALRRVDDGNWWNFPIVDVQQISPRLSNNNSSSSRISSMNTNPAAGNPTTKGEAKTNPKLKLKLKTSSNSGEKKKKKKKLEKPLAELVGENNNNNNSSKEDSAPAAVPPSQPPLPLDAGLLLKLNYEDVLSAWSDRGSPFSDDIEGHDVSARLAQIDLFSENGGVREASVLRYKEKRRTRLFSKKIRYQVRKVNADQRPRMKGRFVRQPNSSNEKNNKFTLK